MKETNKEMHIFLKIPLLVKLIVSSKNPIKRTTIYIKKERNRILIAFRFAKIKSVSVEGF